MGCYDMIFLETVCPYCKKKSLIEYQTKDMNRMFLSLKKNDKVPPKFQDLTFLEAIGDCHSPDCQERADKFSLSFQDRPTGFGALYNVKIALEQGIITGYIYDIKIEKEYSDEYLNKNRDRWEERYKPRGEDDYIRKKYIEIQGGIAKW